jgi:hypothetical protein
LKITGLLPMVLAAALIASVTADDMHNPPKPTDE